MNVWADGEWDTVPRVVGRMNQRRPRLQALGNALVPQIVQWIGGRIMAYEAGEYTDPMLPTRY